MSTTVFIISFALGICVHYIWCMEVIPERANVGYINEKYATGVRVYVRRYTRRGNYYINIIGTIKQPWANNVSLQFVFYEYLHNEYKRSFVQWEIKLCDLVKEKYIGTALQGIGLECPVTPRTWSLYNLSLPTQNFPNVWPFEKSRLDIRFETFPGKDHMGDMQFYLLFKQNLKA